MAIPSEIRKLLGNREPTAHASLSASFHGPIGETHFVVADGQLFVFQRESLIGDFEPVQLDPAHPPKLEKGTFNDVLHVSLADGTPHELQVSSFDRDGIQRVLEANAAPAEQAEATAKTSSPESDTPLADVKEFSDMEKLFDTGDKAAEEKEETSSLDDAANEFNKATEKLQGLGSEEDSGLIDLKSIETPQAPDAFRVEPYKAEEPKPAEPPVTPVVVDKDEAREEAEALKEAEKNRNKNIYYGSDPGCVGCLIQVVLFLGGILGMWYAHEIGMLNIGVVEPDQEYDESAIFVITKIVAVIAGIYLGGKSASLFGKLFQKLNWTGWVAFVKDRAVVIGQRGKWQTTLELSQPIEFDGGAHSSISASTDDKGRPNKRSFNVFMRVIQGSVSFTLKTSISRAGNPASFSGIPLQALSEERKDERMITMDNKTFRAVIKRLQGGR